MMKGKIIAWILAIIVVLVIIYFSVSYFTRPGNYDEFAKCLTEKEVIMYGTDWCHFCKEQKAMFGKSFKHIDYINCDFNKDACDSAGVSGYPTWVINNENYPGTRSLDYLASVSGCNI